MNVLWMTAYYDPEQISSSHLMNDMEEAFVQAGYTLTIHTPTPTRGVSPEVRNQYKKIKKQEKYDGKIKINRFSLPGEGRNPVFRFLRYLLCNLIQYGKGIASKDADLLFSVSTPPTQGLLCAFIKKKHKIPFIYNLQDVFPDSLIHSGLTQSGSLLHKLGRKIEDYTYKNADKIIVISEDFKKNIMEKGVPEEKIEVVNNWVDEEAVVPVCRKDNALFDELQLDRTKFYVVYAGNLGAAQGIDILLDAAEQLKPYDDIQILIFGSGSGQENYQAEIKKRGLTNISMFPLQPKEKISQVYSLGDVSIVSCKEGFGKSAMPSKTWSILSAGTALIASFDAGTELQKLTEDYAFGIFTPAGDTDSFYKAVLQLYHDREACRTYGQNGRAFICNYRNKKSATQRYVAILQEVYGDFNK